MQGPGKVVEQRAADRLGHQGLVHLRQRLMEQDTLLVGCPNDGGPLPGIRLTPRPQKHVGGAPLPLQRVHQVANALDQFAQLKKVLQMPEFAALGGDDIVRDRRSRPGTGQGFCVHVSAPAAPGGTTWSIPPRLQQLAGQLPARGDSNSCIAPQQRADCPVMNAANNHI